MCGENNRQFMSSVWKMFSFSVIAGKDRHLTLKTASRRFAAEIWMSSIKCNGKARKKPQKVQREWNGKSELIKSENYKLQLWQS